MNEDGRKEIGNKKLYKYPASQAIELSLRALTWKKASGKGEREFFQGRTMGISCFDNGGYTRCICSRRQLGLGNEETYECHRRVVTSIEFTTWQHIFLLLAFVSGACSLLPSTVLSKSLVVFARLTDTRAHT